VRPAGRWFLVSAGFVAAVAAPTLVSAQPERFEARTRYLSDCATCHGAGGEGTFMGPAIARAGAAFVDYELSTGRMPLSRPDDTTRRRPPRYRPSEIRALVAYVAGLGGGAGEPIPRLDLARASIQQGGELFRLECAACHSWSGGGGALLLREAPDLHAATPTQVAEAVRVGPGTMPRFTQAAFSDRELASVVTYVRYLDHPRDRGGASLWRLGPSAEGLVAWVAGMGLLLLAVMWIGERS
jgi:ubiquinol-cytochrome c reductase cytochrome c subunit